MADPRVHAELMPLIRVQRPSGQCPWGGTWKLRVEAGHEPKIGTWGNRSPCIRITGREPPTAWPGRPGLETTGTGDQDKPQPWADGSVMIQGKVKFTVRV